MISTLKDISNKIAKPVADALIDITAVAGELELPFFVVGATARDIVFSELFDVRTNRATLDVDLGIRVNSWDEYARLIARLIKSGAFAKTDKQMQRLKSKGGVLVDVIPFGNIEHPAGIISWPPHNDIIMKTIGFEEGLQHSTKVTIAHDPDVVINVCTPASLTVMKLIAWHDRNTMNAKDATDILFLLSQYINAGNENRLYATDRDIHEEEDFDFERASARLLGRDVRKISSAETLGAILNILESETSENSQFRLLSDMSGKEWTGEPTGERNLMLLNQFKKGIKEEMKPLTQTNQ